MTSSSTLVAFLVVCVGVTYSTWTMSGYACGQPQLYNQCQCPSFCGGYAGGGYPGGGSTYIYPQYRDSSYGSEYSRYQEFVRKHKPKPKKPAPKKKFHFSEEEDDSASSLEEFNSKEFGSPAAEKKPEATTNSWDNEDLWEKKFVKTKSGEELPEITSAEIESATAAPQPRPQPQPQPQPAAGGGQGIGPIGIGSGVGVGGIGVNTGLGITAPGVGGGGLGGGGLGGLGSGGLVGVNSGLGIGIPGVGPIGVSSGIGVGK